MSQPVRKRPIRGQHEQSAVASQPRKIEETKKSAKKTKNDKTNAKKQPEPDQIIVRPNAGINRQALPPPNATAAEIPQFQHPELNGVVISPREGQIFSISQLIDDAKPGTIINIPSGTYEDELVVNRQIKFVANGSVKIISKGEGPVVKILADGVSFRGFEFSQRDSESNSHAAILVESGSALFLDCSIKSESNPSLSLTNKSIVNANGCRFISRCAPNLLAKGDSSGTFELCNFQGSTSNGVVLRDNSHTKFSRCTMQGFMRSGVVVCNHAVMSMEKCRITACSQNGIDICTDTLCIINDTSIEGCGGCGISAFNLAGLSISGSTIEGCFSSGIEVREGAAVRTNSNVFSHCGAPATLYAYEQATIDSCDDKFTATSTLAIGAVGNSSIMMMKATIEDISGRGALVCENATLSFVESRFERTDATSVSCICGGSLVLSQSFILNSGELGIFISECNSAQIVKTHIDSCSFSGAEISKVPIGITIDECNFTRCRQCGILIIDSTLEISVSNAMQNCFSGFEIRRSSVSLHRCRSEENSNGGICCRQQTEALIDTCIIQKNGQVGLSLESKSTVKAANTTMESNKRLGIAVEFESFITLKSCIISEHGCVALQIEGKDSRAFLDKSTFNGNDTAILCLMDGRIAGKSCTFEENTLHIELRDKAKMKFSDCKFSCSTDKAAINVTSACIASLDDCEIFQNEGIGIASEGDIKIEKCQIFENQIGAFCYHTCSGNISQCNIYNNGKCGVFIQQGTIRVDQNVIKNHEAYGIVIEERAQPDIKSNEFDNNALLDINRK